MALRNSLTEWRKICKVIRNTSLSASEIKTIASCNLNLLNKKSILNDLDFLCAFHEVFLFTHFYFFQHGDLLTRNMSGFQSRHIAGRLFFMLNDLDEQRELYFYFDAHRKSFRELDDSKK